MKTFSLKLSLAALALTTACSSGSGVKYFIIGAGQYTVPQGTNCGGLTNGLCSLPGLGPNCTETSTEDAAASWAIYPGSGSTAYLVGVLSGGTAGNGSIAIVGSQTGSGYTFAGKTLVTEDVVCRVPPAKLR